MKKCRFIRTRYSYADFSTTISPSVELALEQRKAPNTVILNIFNEDSITVGYLDDPVKSLDLEYCRNARITVRRRQNNGGAVFGAKGSAIICLMVDMRLGWAPFKNIREAFSVLLVDLSVVIQEIFGIDAVYRPLNDIEVDGKKLVATSARLENDILTVRLIVNVAPTNRSVLDKAIKLSPEKAVMSPVS